MKLAVLFSGGKDSCLALQKAMETDEVACLITIVSENPESYMFHTPNIELTKLQAEAAGLPLVRRVTKGVREKELEDLKAAISEAAERFGIEGVVTGAVESVYQSSRVQKICDDLGLWCFNPLWLKDQKELLEEILDSGFRVIISGVFAYPFSREWLGRMIDTHAVGELLELHKKYSISPAGEGGEFETTVLDAPFFRKSVDIKDFAVEYSEYSGRMIVKSAGLSEKL
ncbi:MAG: TIGR00289 family protein [Candidatus Aenigmarchaeota archaeon]|nr:TIGR00289 family protein [Candidatus Aenigmarchaeota archaeon]